MSEQRLKRGGRIPNSIVQPTTIPSTTLLKTTNTMQNTRTKSASDLYKDVNMKELMAYYHHRTNPSDELVRSVSALREYSRTIPYSQFMDEMITRYPEVLLEPGPNDHMNLSDPYCDNNTQTNLGIIQFLGSIRTAYDINDIFNTK